MSGFTGSATEISGGWKTFDRYSEYFKYGCWTKTYSLHDKQIYICIVIYLLGYVLYFLEMHPDILDETISENQVYQKHILKFLKKTPANIDIGVKEAAEITMSRSDLSQRGFKCIKKILSKQGVSLPQYDVI